VGVYKWGRVVGTVVVGGELWRAMHMYAQVYE
jgi:hypothetical protein